MSNPEPDDHTLVPREWEKKIETPRKIDLFDPKYHDEVMTFSRPRGLMRQGQIVAFKAQKARFVMLMVIATLMIMTGVVVAISGFSGSSGFVLPTLLATYTIASLILTCIFVWFLRDERRFRKALEAETNKSAPATTKPDVAGAEFGSAYGSSNHHDDRDGGPR